MLNEDYSLYESKIILNNHKLFLQECDMVMYKYHMKFNNSDSTWNYDKYNLFSLSSNSTLFYDLYKELTLYVKDYFKDTNKRIWMESWINYHSCDDVEEKLKYHYHDYEYHGYISVDPKNTTTIFPNYSIENKVGQIYIGKGGKGYEHAVKVNEKYDGNRITIAFDISLKGNQTFLNNHFYPVI